MSYLEVDDLFSGKIKIWYKHPWTHSPASWENSPTSFVESFTWYVLDFIIKRLELEPKVCEITDGRTSLFVVVNVIPWDNILGAELVNMDSRAARQAVYPTVLEALS
jgi:hypothetical protein